jgi:2'-5' RNA ligase
MPLTHATQLRNHWWWRPGWNAKRRFYTWHLTFDGQHQLHQLVSAYQDALSDVPGLDLIPVPWLHLTVQGVGFTDEVRPDQARAIADAASQRLAALPPIELTFHKPVIRPEALALPPAPMQPLATIRDTIRDGIADLWGSDDVPETDNRFDPHLSLAYVNTNGPADAAHQALTRVYPELAQITIKEASLIVLRRDEHLYRWDTFANAPFAGNA